ncbi:MAG TPA: GMC family oxidoreductase [Candidatus Polarisedimenticolia bacterium]|nr:GMC family oxidoreductase [Candidatus Polarisedimenticolia bacterium]
MENANRYDVIIIGTGAGGGTLAWRLAPTGLRILLIERGDDVPRETDNWSTRAAVTDGKYNIKEAWLDPQGKEFHAGAHYCVGGNTKFYGAALLRMRREDFGEVRHHGGVSPAWPLSYEDLEPYYTQAERLYQVHGERGVDPTDPPASAPYDHPPVSHEPRLQGLSDDLARQGLRPFHVPLAVMLDEGNRRRSRCIRCATCDGHPCLVYAKADAQVICVDPALEHPNVTMITNATVTRLATDAPGSSVSAVHVERDGGVREIFEGGVVVASCGAINSAALLLRSRSDRHPEGLANGSGLVGRNYMCHLNSVMLAVSLCPNPTVFQKTLAINDFYYAGRDWDYPMGHISFVGKTDGNVLAAGAPKLVPGWTLEKMAQHSLDFWLTSEDLPDPANRVTVTTDGRVQLHYKPNNEEGHRRLQAKVKEFMKKSRCAAHGERCVQDLLPLQAYIGKRIPLAGVAHQNGTLRFGSDPKTSVLDRDCKTHELDNLYVVDGSFFPSSSAVNPALTIMANALRIGDHLAARLGR